MSTDAQWKRASRGGYIVIDETDKPEDAHQLAQAAKAFHAFCKANDRPYAAATLAPEACEVVLDMAPCSWELCEACLARLRTVIATYPDGPTQTLSMGPKLIRATGLSRLGAPFLAWELVGDAIDCRKRHGLATTDESAPRMFEVSRPTSPEPRAEVVPSTPSPR